MELSFARVGDVHIVRVEGSRLTYPLLSSFFGQVRQVVEGGARKLIVDLERVSWLDSPSLACLMDIQRLLKKHEGALKLSGLQPRVESMVFMSGFPRVVDVRRSPGDALAAFGLASRARCLAPSSAGLSERAVVPQLAAHETRYR